MTEYEKIMSRVKSDYDKLVAEGHEVVGVFLQGSQNYNLQYESSDIDTKAIILPSFRDIILNKKPVSTTLVLETDEHIDLKDIRLMFECFKKQNVNFVEILFTKYKVFNPKYEDIFLKMCESREAIAKYNNYAGLNCMVGMIYEKYAAMEHLYPSKVEIIEKIGYDPKQISHILRLSEFIERMFIENTRYEDCLVTNKREEILGIKRGLLSLEEARVLAKSLVDKAKTFKEEYMSTKPVVINEGVELLLEDTLVKIFEKHLKTNKWEGAIWLNLQCW